jgi:Ca2+-binding EF-hand superfamily protein
MDDNRTIDFIEFFSGLDKLRIKMSEQDALNCFKYLNSKGDGEIDYNQFCALVEERRRNIDPFYNTP